MYKYDSINQLKSEGFETEFELSLDSQNRWIKLSSLVPWDNLVNEYIKSLNDMEGSPGINPPGCSWGINNKTFIESIR